MRNIYFKLYIYNCLNGAGTSYEKAHPHFIHFSQDQTGIVRTAYCDIIVYVIATTTNERVK